MSESEIVAAARAGDSLEETPEGVPIPPRLAARSDLSAKQKDVLAKNRFKPGQSGYRGGRGGRLRDEIAALIDDAEIAKHLVDIARDSKVAARDRLRALEMLMVRRYGRVRAEAALRIETAHESTHTQNRALQIYLSELSDDELERFRSGLQRALALAAEGSPAVPEQHA